MSDENVRVPAGWYPDPLGLPQLRWWDNHAWTEHVSDARQPMVAQDNTAASASASVGAAAAAGATAAGASAGGASNDYGTRTTTTGGSFDGSSAFDEPEEWRSGYGRTTTSRSTTDYDSAWDFSGTDLGGSHDYDFQGDFDAPMEQQPDFSLPTDYSASYDFATEDPFLTRRERRQAESRSFDPFGDVFADPTETEPAPAPANDAKDPASALAFDDAQLSLEAPSRNSATEGASPAARYARSSSMIDAPASAPYALDIRFDDLLGGAGTDPRAAQTHLGDQEQFYIPTDVPTRSATGTRLGGALSSTTGTVWAMALLPLAMLFVGLLFLLSGAAGTLSSVLLAVIIGLPYVGGVALAAADRSALQARGFTETAHWGWALLTVPAYLVVRLAAVVRETGRGYGPFMTWGALAVFTVGAILAVPGLVIALAPLQFAREAEASVEYDASLRGADGVTIRCPDTPPMLVQQQFTCEGRNASGELFYVTVSLQRANGWIDWRVDDWGVNQM